MEINPRPKVIVTIFKSRVHVGATPRRNTIFGSRDMFTKRCFVAERSKEDLADTERLMALFLKEQLLPICIKTHALVFLHDTTCGISAAFGSLCQAERSKRNGQLPFSVMSLAGAHNICMVSAPFFVYLCLYLQVSSLLFWCLDSARGK